MTTPPAMANDTAYSVITRRYVYRNVFWRLIYGWLFLCVLAGTAVFWLEMHRVEQSLRGLALAEARAFSGAAAENLGPVDGAANSHLANLAKQLVAQHFLIAEVYDGNKQLKYEAVRSGLESLEKNIVAFRRQIPQHDDLSHELHWIDGKLWLVIFLPLKTDPQGGAIGYFRGVYQVEQQDYLAIRHDVARTLILVTVGISFAVLLMYPVIVTLIRGSVKLSSRLLQGNLELLSVLGCAISERDSETNSHNYRVTYYALKLGEAAGLGVHELRRLIAGAFLHDVGKIGIRDPILLKPGRLTEDEYAVMKTHVALGVAIIDKSQWLSGARDVVAYHHEHYDGSGYLKGLKGEQIPVNARIFAIADVFDALTSARPYKKSWQIQQALAHLNQNAGSHFDPALLALFVLHAQTWHQQLSGLNDMQLEDTLQDLIGRYFLHEATDRK